MTKAQKAEQTAAIETLRTYYKPGDTVHTLLESMSRSGMSRSIRVVLPVQEPDRRTGRPSIDFLHPNHLVAVALGLRRSKSGDGVILGGCGMDMGFALAYELSHALYPTGYECIGQGCPSNDHSNGDRDYTPHRHAEGGYALRHRWL